MIYRPLSWTLCWIVFSVVVYREEFRFFYDAWAHSNAFSHGFFIIPLAIYFAWRAKANWLSVERHPSWSAAFLALVFVLVELFGQLLSISIVQQFAVVAILASGIVACIGWKAARRLWFPISLLGFMPPVGLELVGYFQIITADLAVWLLSFTPVPVYRDGLYITIPKGVFVVAEACSGVRFFITCAFLGYVYTFYNFYHPLKRLAFFSFALALPIIANGLRVLVIILAGHYVDMKYAKGVDHLIVGWVFLAVMTLILIGVALFFAERSPATAVQADWRVAPGWKGLDVRKPALVLLGVLLIALSAKILVSSKDFRGEYTVSDEWKDVPSEEKSFEWSPVLSNPAGELIIPIVSRGQELYGYVGWYNEDTSHSELLTGQNRLYDIDKWTYVSSQRVAITVAGELVDAQYMLIVAPTGMRRFILYWYDVPGCAGASSIKIKVCQGINKLLQRFHGGRLLALSGRISQSQTSAEQLDHLQKLGAIERIAQATRLSIE